MANQQDGVYTTSPDRAGEDLVARGYYSAIEPVSIGGVAGLSSGLSMPPPDGYRSLTYMPASGTGQTEIHNNEMYSAPSTESDLASRYRRGIVNLSPLDSAASPSSQPASFLPAMNGGAGFGGYIITGQPQDTSTPTTLPSVNVAVLEANAVNTMATPIVTPASGSGAGITPPIVQPSAPVVDPVPALPVSPAPTSGGPSLTLSASSTSVLENVPVGTVLATVTTDAGASLAVYGSDLVAVQGNQIVTAAPFDYETLTSLLLTVAATNAGGTTTRTLGVAIGNVDEAPTSPTILSLTGTGLGTDSAVGTEIARLTATDPEGGAVGYQIIDGGDGLSVGTDGRVVTTGALTVGTHTVSVAAVDAAGNTSATSTFAFTVDAPIAPPSPPPPPPPPPPPNFAPTGAPAFTAGGTVTEGAANATVVGTIGGATDPEGQAVTYVLAPGGDAGGRFSITGGNQVVVADASMIDFDSWTTHTINVQARDPGGNLGTATAITVAVASSWTIGGDTVTAPGLWNKTTLIDALPGSDTLNLQVGSNTLASVQNLETLNLTGSADDLKIGVLGLTKIYAGAGDDVIEFTDPTALLGGKTTAGGSLHVYGDAGYDEVKVALNTTLPMYLYDVEKVTSTATDATGRLNLRLESSASGSLEVTGGPSAMESLMLGANISAINLTVSGMEFINAYMAASNGHSITLTTAVGTSANRVGINLSDMTGETVYLAAGTNYMSGIGKAEFIYGSAGDDVLDIQAIYGQGGGVVTNVAMGDGNDVFRLIMSGSGNIGLVDGGNGNDTIDIVSAVAFGSTYGGGAGADTFICRDAWANMTIVDFNEIDGDVLNLAGRAGGPLIVNGNVRLTSAGGTDSTVTLDVDNGSGWRTAYTLNKAVSADGTLNGDAVGDPVTQTALDNTLTAMIAAGHVVAA